MGCGTCRGCLFASHGECRSTLPWGTLDRESCRLWAGNIWCGGDAASALATVHADGDLKVVGLDQERGDTASHERARLMRTRTSRTMSSSDWGASLNDNLILEIYRCKNATRGMSILLAR